MLLEFLRERVASPLSYSSLAEDLQLAPNTVKKYVEILESLYIIFLVRPYHKRLPRAILKEPKIYFFDSGYVKGDDGVRFENTCALALMKHAHYVHDTRGKDIALNYLRTKDGREVDFSLVVDDKPEVLIEAKLTDDEPSRSIVHFKEHFAGAKAVQLVLHLHKETHRRGVDIVNAGDWLASLEA